MGGGLAGRLDGARGGTGGGLSERRPSGARGGVRDGEGRRTRRRPGGVAAEQRSGRHGEAGREAHAEAAGGEAAERRSLVSGTRSQGKPMVRLDRT